MGIYQSMKESKKVGIRKIIVSTCEWDIIATTWNQINHCSSAQITYIKQMVLFMVTDDNENVL